MISPTLFPFQSINSPDFLETVLDLGCGGGELLPSRSRLYPRVTAIYLLTDNAKKLIYH